MSFRKLIRIGPRYIELYAILLVVGGANQECSGNVGRVSVEDTEGRSIDPSIGHETHHLQHGDVAAMSAADGRRQRCAMSLDVDDAICQSIGAIILVLVIPESRRSFFDDKRQPSGFLMQLRNVRLLMDMYVVGNKICAIDRLHERRKIHRRRDEESWAIEELNRLQCLCVERTFDVLKGRRCESQTLQYENRLVILLP